MVLSELNSQQIQTVLKSFAVTLGGLSTELAENGLGRSVRDVSLLIESLADEIAARDSEVALEIVKSTARVIANLRRLTLKKRDARRLLH